MRIFLAILSACLCLTLQPLAASAASLVASIDLSSQTMTVTQRGIVKYRWAVSTARKGFSTPTGSWTAKWASRHHKSRKYNMAPMPHSIFFHGGYAIHGTYDLKRLGRPASHGCVRLHPDNAATFFSLANRAGLKNTRVVITR